MRISKKVAAGSGASAVVAAAVIVGVIFNAGHRGVFKPATQDLVLASGSAAQHKDVAIPSDWPRVIELPDYRAYDSTITEESQLVRYDTKTDLAGVLGAYRARSQSNGWKLDVKDQFGFSANLWLTMPGERFPLIVSYSDAPPPGGQAGDHNVAVVRSIGQFVLATPTAGGAAADIAHSAAYRLPKESQQLLEAMGYEGISPQPLTDGRLLDKVDQIAPFVIEVRQSGDPDGLRQTVLGHYRDVLSGRSDVAIQTVIESVAYKTWSINFRTGGFKNFGSVTGMNRGDSFEIILVMPKG